MTRNALDSEQDQVTVRQLRSIIGMLTNTLQSLGFSAFEATPGEPFDPDRMEIVGRAPSKNSTVIAVEKPGYTSGSTVVARCAVIVGLGEDS
jgi:molecular chaperone GrpE (heat shock protein)